MNKKLTHSLSIGDHENMQSLDQVFSTLKESQKILAQSLKSEISQLKHEISFIKSEIKHQRFELLEKIELIIQSNKDSEETIRNFHKIITDTTQKSLNSIRVLKETQNHIIQQISFLSSSKPLNQSKKPGEFLPASSNTLYADLESSEKLKSLNSQVSLLTTKVNYLYDELSDVDLKAYLPLISNFKQEIDEKISEITASQEILEKDDNVTRRFESLEEFISNQRREVFNSLSTLELKLQNAEDFIKRLVNSLSENGII